MAVLAYDDSGDVSPFSSQIKVAVGAPPQITAQPLSESVVTGGTATFFVSASSPYNVRYQWYNGSVAMTGKTNAALILPNVNDASDGPYSVMVSNRFGDTLSSTAMLTVIDPPVITAQPVAQSASIGGTADFQVVVAGQPPFNFQWYVGGVPIPTGTKSTLHLVNVLAAMAGNYYCTVQNAAGTVTSSGAGLTILSSLASELASTAGVYNGLFYQTNGGQPAIAEQSAGMIANCVVNTDGTYSAKIYLSGTNFPIAGAFSSTGSDTEIVSRAAIGYANLSVNLQLDLTGGSGTISGSVSNMAAGNPWVAPLLAELSTNSLSVAAGTYTLTVPAITGALGVLTGQGTITAVNSTSGVVTLAGTMDDLTAVSETVPISQSGIIPLYFNMYGGQGLAEGWISLIGSAPSGTITWIRPPGILTGTLIPAGFDDTLQIF
jgi:hypothetical protein